MVAMDGMDGMDWSISKKEDGVEGMDEMDWMEGVNEMDWMESEMDWMERLIFSFGIYVYISPPVSPARCLLLPT